MATKGDLRVISAIRFIILAITINMAIGMAISIHQNVTEIDQTAWNTEQKILEEREIEYRSEDGITETTKASTNQQDTSTAGNPISWGKEIINILVNGIYPYSFKPSDFTNPVEQQIASALIFFRGAMMTISLMLGYMVIINKKQD